MNLGRFRFGGVHPHDSKDTADIASSALSNPPKTVLISMSQHIGAPAKMLKNKGDKIPEYKLDKIWEDIFLLWSSFRTKYKR